MSRTQDFLNAVVAKDKVIAELRGQVDRNVTVHLRARQADIYERALNQIYRRQDEAIPEVDSTCAERESLFNRALNDIEKIAHDALKRAEKLK